MTDGVTTHSAGHAQHGMILGIYPAFLDQYAFDTRRVMHIMAFTLQYDIVRGLHALYLQGTCWSPELPNIQD